MRNKHLLIFISFLALALTLRFPSFFQSIIDWDESLYILIARSLKEGNLPYVEVWDHKPPGIYLLFALALIIFGNSIFTIRLVSCIAVAVTSYFLYKSGTTFSKNGAKIGLLSGIFYTIFSLTNGGLSANTEIFFLPCTTIAFYLLIAQNINPERLFASQHLKLFLVGLSLGIGLLIKQLVIFDLIAMMIILGKGLFNHTNNSRLNHLLQLIRCYSLVLFGAVLPFLITLLIYLISGHLNDFIYANFTANVLRSNLGFSFNRFIKAIIVQTVQYFALWSGLILTILYLSLFRNINREDKDKLISGLIWFSFAFLGVCYTKDFWSHYFLQILPALCFLTSYIINQLVSTDRLSRKSRNIVLIPIVLGLVLSSYFVIRSLIKSTEIIYFRFVKGINNWGDPTAVVADYVKKRISRNYIYVVDDQPIIYFLAQAKVPTKYVFPGHLLGEDFAKVAGIDSLQELNSIIRKKPIYILKRGKNVSDGRQAVYTGLDQYLKSLIEGLIATKTSEAKTETTNQNKETLTDKFYADLDKYLKENYTLEMVIEGIEIYKLKN